MSTRTYNCSDILANSILQIRCETTSLVFYNNYVAYTCQGILTASLGSGDCKPIYRFNIT